MSSVIISGDTSGAITLSAPAVAGTNTATLPAATGTVMVSGNMPAFSAYPSTGQSFSNAVWTKVTLDSEEFDTNSNFSSSRFTPTVAGYYQVNGQVSFSFTSSFATCSIYKNGAAVRYGLTPTANANGVTTSTNAIIYLNGTTDYIEFYVYQAAGTQSLSAGSQNTYFQAGMIRTA